MLRAVKKYCDVEFCDLITEPGPDKVLSENKDEIAIQSIRRGVDLSLKAHKSRMICVVGHHDCVANNSFHEEHKKQLQKSAELLKEWYPDKIVAAFWIDHHWSVEKI